ncbi:MAG: trans-sulfuration enzyme family protein [Candidatus Hodarchaeota archaeon]
MKGKDVKDYRFDTRVVHAGQSPDAATGAIITPIYQTATYVLEEIGKDKGYQYTRTNNPTRTVLETLIAELEGSRYGIAFSSGMAAADAIVRAILESGDHLVVGDDVYGGIYRLFEQHYAKKFGLKFNFVDTRQPNNFKNAIIPETLMIWLETPTNPLLKISDIISINKIVEKVNKGRNNEKKIILVVDNTFLSPYFLQPLTLGADIVFHSTTKYLSGHNQLVGGVVAIRDDPQKWYYEYRTIEDKPEIVNKLFENLKFIQNAAGAVPGPFDCWLSILGIKTLALRMQKQEENSLKIVEFLQNHPKIEKVYYPGLETHINHAIAKSQMKGFGAMISFELKGNVTDAIKFMNLVKLWSLAESLGAVESMITHPASMTHSAIPSKIRIARGITDGLIRLSVGIESVDDLISDLNQALEEI